MKKKLFLLLFWFLPAGLLKADFLYMPDDVGISPVSVGSQQIFSPYLEVETAAYYNPALLAGVKNSEFSLNYVYYVPDLSASHFSIDFNAVNYTVFCFVLPITHVVRIGNNFTFGLVTGADSFFSVPFQYYDARSDNPQFFRYDSPQMIVTPSFGFNLFKHIIKVGLGLNMYVYANNEMDVNAQVNGTGIEGTKAEFDSKMKDSVIAGTFIDAGVFNFGFVYRQGYGYKIDVTNKSDVYAKDFKITTVNMNLYFYDAFAPSTYEARTIFNLGRYSLGFRLRYKEWSKLTSLLDDNDMIRGNKGVEFRDILSVSGGVRYFIGGKNKINLFAAIGFEPTPLVSKSTPLINFVDANRYVASIGTTILYSNDKFFYKPLKLGIGYRFGFLEKRKFTIVDSDDNSTTTTISGFTNSFSLMIAIAF